jgi:pimeloyl-ACP methyl ester carboxylesterase
MTSRSDGVNVVEAGSNDPVLLFVHGFGCSLADWRAQIETLSTSHRCVALDLPGHGSSGLPEAPTIEALAAAVNTVKSACGSKKVVLVGHSLGCKVIREAYARSPESVVGMVFIEGAYYQAEREALVRRVEEAIDAEGFASFAQRHFGDMFSERSDPSLREHALERIARMDHDFAKGLYLNAVGWDPLRGQSTLDCISVPVLVLQSTFMDSGLKRQSLQPGMRTPFMKAVASRVHRVEFKVILGCGHFSVIEASGIVSRCIAEFTANLREDPHDVE